MSNSELNTLVNELKELQVFRSEIDEQIVSIESQIKAHLTATGAEETRVGMFLIKWKDITSKRFDSTAFKRDYPDLYGMYVSQSVCKRFTVS